MYRISKQLKHGTLPFFRLSATAAFVVCVAGPLAIAQFPTTGRHFGSQIDIPAQEKRHSMRFRPRRRR